MNQEDLNNITWAWDFLNKEIKAKNPKTTPEELTNLANEPSPIPFYVCRNPNTPEIVRRIIKMKGKHNW